MAAAVALQGPQLVQVGRVTAVFWPGDEAVATAMAEMADAAVAWPGLSQPVRFPLRLILVPNGAIFDSVTRGRMPEWGSGVAFPGTNTIVLGVDRQTPGILRHELAHLALRNTVRRVPLWFDEGYASRAAGEWGRLDALRVNWALAMGDIPTLTQVNRDLRGSANQAHAGYALATTAVLLLERMGGDGGLTRLVATLAKAPDFDAALRQTYAVTLDQFEVLWIKDLRRRYGWLFLVTSFSVFWSLVLVLVLAVWRRRRRRDRQRRAALDEGWTIDPDDVTPA